MDEIEKLEAELAEAEAASKAAKEIEARNARAAELKARIQAEQVAARDMPKLAELDGTRGVDFDVVVCRLGHVAVRKPSPVVWKRFLAGKDDRGRAQDARDSAAALVRSCLLYPDSTTFTEIVDDQPAVLESIALTVARLAGADTERVQGKS